ncbi:aminoglycoside 6'-N-acetyltransferase [Ferdinandcohnia sp. Marseille-Q9671]
MIVKAKETETKELAKLALLLWPDNEEDEITHEFLELVQDENAVAFLAKVEEEYIGFAQCQLRVDYVEGTQSSPVGYLEGIYVMEEHRGKGAAKQLLQACETWAKSKGCTEFASDVELENSNSLAFHLKNGFQEANRIICLTKRL